MNAKLLLQEIGERFPTCGVVMFLRDGRLAASVIDPAELPDGYVFVDDDGGQHEDGIATDLVAKYRAMRAVKEAAS